MNETYAKMLEEYQIIQSDPDDPSTWPIWDMLGYETFGEKYKELYRQDRAELRRAKGLDKD